MRDDAPSIDLEIVGDISDQAIDALAALLIDLVQEQEDQPPAAVCRAWARTIEELCQ